jgi:pentatricopeptide repeat protein
MQTVFEHMASNPEIVLMGSHWASLINAHGCIAKDLNRAIGIFESIATHPSTARSKSPMPDAVAYEALFDVLSFHRRPDLIPVYMHRLTTSQVRPTAYVANAVIKGYSVVGDIDSARTMFESLHDPPTGIAAPFNHGTTKGGVRQYQKPNDQSTANIVYREVSINILLEQLTH